MILIDPIPFANMTYVTSNIILSSYGAWSSATAYNIGNRVNYNGRDYECLVGNTNVVPSSDSTKWLDLGVVNRFKAFDQSINSQSIGQNGLTWSFRIKPNSNFNAIALFNITSGSSVNIQVIDPSEGVVYNSTKTLVDNSQVYDWYQYFYAEILNNGDVVFTDLPSYVSADILITITTDTYTSVGEIVIGTQKNLGLANFGTSIGIKDYSKKDVDQFGNYLIVERKFAKTIDYDITVDTSKVNSAYTVLSKLRAKPVVYIGNPDLPETIVYGFYKNFSVVISNPSMSSCSLEVEGLT